MTLVATPKRRDIRDDLATFNVDDEIVNDILKKIRARRMARPPKGVKAAPPPKSQPAQTQLELVQPTTSQQIDTQEEQAALSTPALSHEQVGLSPTQPNNVKQQPAPSSPKQDAPPARVQQQPKQQASRLELEKQGKSRSKPAEPEVLQNEPKKIPRRQQRQQSPSARPAKEKLLRVQQPKSPIHHQQNKPEKQRTRRWRRQPKANRLPQKDCASPTSHTRGGIVASNVSGHDCSISANDGAEIIFEIQTFRIEIESDAVVPGEVMTPKKGKNQEGSYVEQYEMVPHITPKHSPIKVSENQTNDDAKGESDVESFAASKAGTEATQLTDLPEDAQNVFESKVLQPKQEEENLVQAEPCSLDHLTLEKVMNELSLEQLHARYAYIVGGCNASGDCSTAMGPSLVDIHSDEEKNEEDVGPPREIEVPENGTMVRNYLAQRIEARLTQRKTQLTEAAENQEMIEVSRDGRVGAKSPKREFGRACNASADTLKSFRRETLVSTCPQIGDRSPTVAKSHSPRSNRVEVFRRESNLVESPRPTPPRNSPPGTTDSGLQHISYEAVILQEITSDLKEMSKAFAGMRKAQTTDPEEINRIFDEVVAAGQETRERDDQVDEDASGSAVALRDSPRRMASSHQASLMASLTENEPARQLANLTNTDDPRVTGQTAASRDASGSPRMTKPPALRSSVSRTASSSQVQLGRSIESRLTISPHNSLGSTSSPAKFRRSIESRVTLSQDSVLSSQTRSSIRSGNSTRQRSGLSNFLPHWPPRAPSTRKTKSAQQAPPLPTRNQSSVVGPPSMKKAQSAEARLLMALPEWGAPPSVEDTSYAAASNRSIESTLTGRSGKWKTGATKATAGQVTTSTNEPMSLASLSKGLAVFLQPSEDSSPPNTPPSAGRSWLHGTSPFKTTFAAAYPEEEPSLNTSNGYGSTDDDTASVVSVQIEKAVDTASGIFSTDATIDDMWLAKVVLNKYARTKGINVDDLIEDVCDKLDAFDTRMFLPTAIMDTSLDTTTSAIVT